MSSPPRPTVAELLAPARSALLVIDVQNDFIHEEGHFARHGRDVRPLQRMVPRLQELVDRARQAGTRVVFVQQSTLPDGASDSPAWRYFKTRDGKSPDYTLVGTWGEAFYEVAPAPGELVVRKHRPSAFHGTELARLLRIAGVDTVLSCGVLTQGCVLATVLDASFHDFYSLVATDAVASPDQEQHELALRFLASRYDTVANADVRGIWAPAVGAAR